MKEKKSFFIIVSIIVVMILIVMISIMYLKVKDNNNPNKAELIVDKEIKEVEKGTKHYNIVLLQIKSYFNYLKLENKDAIYSLLDKRYIEENNIQKSNVLKAMNSKYSIFSIKKVYIRDEILYPSFYIHINCININDTTQSIDFYAKLRLDGANVTYSILPIKKEEYDKEINKRTSKTDNTSIERNSYNTYKGGDI